MGKCQNCGLYKGGVGNARRAKLHNRILLDDGLPVNINGAKCAALAGPT